MNKICYWRKKDNLNHAAMFEKNHTIFISIREFKNSVSS